MYALGMIAVTKHNAYAQVHVKLTAPPEGES
jgi:hypothetical protein